jgi:hypothetical protein
MKQIADKLKEKNIAEYLIYMWQVEDLIRANDCDIDKLTAGVIASYQLPDDKSRQEQIEWFENLINMMRTEDVMDKGHLQINKNVILELNDLHASLLSTTRYPYYHASYYKALPFIVELRQKNKKEESEIETCFEAMYGVLLLRLQKKEISEDTRKAIDAISSFLSMLANYFEKDRNNELEW